jgi:hypothetical protein
MTLPRAIDDREYQKFEEVAGEPHVRVTGAGFSGSFSQSGLTIAGLHTEVTIDDVSWTPLPATPQVNRNAIGIQNYTGFDLKINFINTPPGYTGMRIPDANEKYYGIKDTIIVYAKAEAGSGPITIDVEELS